MSALGQASRSVGTCTTCHATPPGRPVGANAEHVELIVRALSGRFRAEQLPDDQLDQLWSARAVDETDRPPRGEGERAAARRRNLTDIAHGRRPVPLPRKISGSDTLAVVRLREYYQDPGAPRAHDLLPAAFAAVRDPAGGVLLVRRIDDGNWELPGGRIEVGETARQAVIREVAEESGIAIAITGLSGLYSDPGHVLLDPDGSVHQQLALCFHAVPAEPHEDRPGSRPRPDGVETDAAGWWDPATLAELVMHPAMRLRLHHALTAPHEIHYD